jgi:hypothetical protein
MAQRWVTEEELNSMQNQYAEGGNVQESNLLMEFYNQLPPELQEKIAVLPPEKQQEVLMQLLTKFNNSQQNVENNQQFAEGGEVDSQQIMQMVAQALQQNTPPEQILQMLVEQGIPQEQATQIIEQVMLQMQEQQPEQEFQDGGQAQSIPVEAERNENITVQDGQQPQVEGGYLEQQSHNPITGQSTYEIPDNGHSETHNNGGVNMQLSEGDVVNSDKTKIPIDFKIYGKSFKNKTFKDASDYLSKQENKVQDDYENRIKEGKTDKVSDGTLQIILAKLGKSRNELNELQEQVLESKKQKEQSTLINSQIAEYGKVVLGMNKAEQGFNSSLNRYLNYKVTDRPVLKAADGLNASLAKFEKFANQVNSNPNISIQDIKNAYKQSGLSKTSNSFYNSKIPVSYDYKPKNVTIPKQEIFSTIHSTANKYGVDPTLMFTMADIESSFNPNATSKTGAAGLFQFTKGTGKQYGIEGEKRYDLKANTDAGARLLLDNQKILIKNGIEPTPVYTYLAHQLGAGGAIELYNNITKGTPISASTMKNMGLNFGQKSAEQYLAETTKKVMSRYDGFATKLQDKDSQLALNAHQVKQQYQLPYQPEEIKSDLYNFGIKGITERLKANTYKPTTTNTPRQSSNFAYGGKIYAQDGFNFSIWEGDKTKPGLNKADYTVDDLNFIAKNYFPNIKFESNKQLQEAIIPYLNENFGGYQNYVKPITPNAYKKQNLPYSLYDDKFGDDWNTAIKLLKENTLFPRPINSNAFTPAQDPWLPSQEIKEIPGEYPLTDNTQIVNEKPRDVNKKPAEGGVPVIEEKTSWMDKLKYEMRESLPYLRNLMLMNNEKQFNPVLQQKSYQNPYDNFNTDYSIQSALNDSDRSTLTAMADERGNPSVRSARLAQIAANAIAAKAPLYTQKYNQEQQLQNQKVVGQSQYLNQWEDINRGLRKQHEQEILQTKEVGRQQKNMAIDNMMNIYLRKAEENQAIKLALMETNFDWNKFTQDYEANPEKMKKNFSLQKYLSKNSSTNNGDNIITISGNKYVKKKNGNLECIDCDDPTGKYGLKV